jgi:hypothetical protein
MGGPPRHPSLTSDSAPPIAQLHRALMGEGPMGRAQEAGRGAEAAGGKSLGKEGYGDEEERTRTVVDLSVQPGRRRLVLFECRNQVRTRGRRDVPSELSGAHPPHIQCHAAWPCAELHCTIEKRRPLSGDGVASVQKLGSVNEPQQRAEKKQCHRDLSLGPSCHQSCEAAQIKKRFGQGEVVFEHRMTS